MSMISMNRPHDCIITSTSAIEPSIRTALNPVRRHDPCWLNVSVSYIFFFFFQAEDGIRDYKVTGVQTCALPIWYDLHHPDHLRPVPERKSSSGYVLGVLVDERRQSGDSQRREDHRGGAYR